jgi:hypothetical protein
VKLRRITTGDKIMRIKNEEAWNGWVKANDDPYGGCCVRVAKRVMEILDEDTTPLHDGYWPDVHTPHGIICKADNDIDAGGITGAMAGFVAQMISTCHERGEEFRKIWNKEYAGEGVVNPAIITIETK